MTDREKLTRLLFDSPVLNTMYNSYAEIEEAADHLLANGVTVQKHGRWRNEWGNWRNRECSVCGAVYTWDITLRLCPNCGAKMDMEECHGEE
jgi:predicted amidophosphoribosyltransferase